MTVAVARGGGDHRRRLARVRRRSKLGDDLRAAFDAHGYGVTGDGATDHLVAGKSSGDELRRRRATVYGGIYGYPSK